ncbi:MULTISPECIES: hypothetical protein [unclassified Rhizobium]|uniref:hypothetical protein n=1 Tax=unclassified Rhizobium TaxID=2613769 RepID=UPI000715DB4D|nr:MULTISPECIES: hypothetical protein [unclassified Rhizobium]KQS88465.1 hypothetical protein ASG42_18445 [Rhizobium sp. Leaf391]KQT04116.1 hypothetical protein ASG50_18105 [Rhizobium sp. Leaf386]KQT95429.1 hypothetical protein ASG68_11900 [Rhizobium sp. Leaf453]
MCTGNKISALAYAVCASVLMQFAGGPASAGPLAQAAAKAEALAAAGDTVGAHNLLRSAASDFSAKLPFSIAKAVFVKASPDGYARYDLRDGSSFKPGEKLISYIEPIGLSWKPAPAGSKKQSHFSVDMDILSITGEQLASQKAIGEYTFASLVPNQEIYATLTTDVSGGAAGDYILRFRFNDLNNGKSTTVDQKFTILGPVAQP